MLHDGGEDRAGAIFGWSEHCAATHPSDLGVALLALDAVIHTHRAIPLDELYRLPGHTPKQDTILEAGELIRSIEVPAAATARRSRYLKVRERSWYEFALVSAALGLELNPDGRIQAARVALGGVAPRPWRMPQAERAWWTPASTTRPSCERA